MAYSLEPSERLTESPWLTPCDSPWLSMFVAPRLRPSFQLCPQHVPCIQTFSFRLMLHLVVRRSLLHQWDFGSRTRVAPVAPAPSWFRRHLATSTPVIATGGRPSRGPQPRWVPVAHHRR